MSNLTTASENRVSRFQLKITQFQCDYTWTIPNLKSRCTTTDYFSIKSPLFSAAENTCEWYLELCANYSYVEFYLRVQDTSKLEKYGPADGKFKCSIMNWEGPKVNKESEYFHVDSKADRFLSGAIFGVADLPENETKIYCKISYIHVLNFATLTNQNDTFLLSEMQRERDCEKLLNDEEFSDVTIYVGGKKFPCHKNILATRSSVFKAMLTHDMKEKKLNRIDIDDMDENVFQEVLRYIYTGSVENIQTMAFELIRAADKYDLAILITICENALCQMFTIENAVKFLSLSDTYNLKRLKTNTIEYIQTNLKEIIGSGARNELLSHPDLMMIVLEAYGK